VNLIYELGHCDSRLSQPSMIRYSLNIGRQHYFIRHLERTYIPELPIGFSELSLDICLVFDGIRGLFLAGRSQKSTLLVPASRAPPLRDASVRVPINASNRVSILS
jgi:hypothetical protein